MEEFEGVIIDKKIHERGYRWTLGEIKVKDGKGRLQVFSLLGTIIQWLKIGDRVSVKLREDGTYLIYKLIPNGRKASGKEYEAIQLWPLFSREFFNPRYSPLTGEKLYEYRIVAREASTESDYLSIVGLEQYHYASKKELVAIWQCDGKIIESNIQPDCNGEKAELVAIKGSLPASRFLVLELKDRRPFEPKIIGYVRIDPPVPLMHRRIEEDGKVIVEKNIRLKVFPKGWIYPTFWPKKLLRDLRREYRELASKYGSRKAFFMLGEKIRWEALERCDTAAARISRVVIHPDYRGDGLGMLAVKAALEWVKERRVPEMRKRKHIVEVIAQMARYHPFFEKVGFKYLWDTASGRPVLYYPLTEEANKRIEKFLKEDKYASKHGGVLYRSRFSGISKLSKPIILKNVSKIYSSTLDIDGLVPKLQEILKAFGVVRRTVQKYVLREVNVRIEPSSIVAVIGISGAGKTTLLRMIIGAVLGIKSSKYRPDSGEIEIPENTRLSVLLPGEIEPRFGDESILEHVYEKIGDEIAAIEVLNISGLSDAVFYRARFSELSTGQKERAKIASLLAEKPNLLIIDEFTAHLDSLTAQRVARKISKIARKHGITMILATHRPEVLKVLEPDMILHVGYGGIICEHLKH
ncbi:MAG: ABC transporter ATP-binding protein [Thermoprotei archaeon]|nr:MAG: ABC transporter ATP-binding protein [Thermoprotei archaeon]